MSNTFYVDCNRQNSAFSTDANNEWTYKLNTEQLLPKGTEIQLQNSFLNKKGINGGSIEIDDDILESIAYSLYITEEPQFNPVGEYENINNPWYRSTLTCAPSTFRGNFREPIGATEVTDIVYGEVLEPANPTNYNGLYKTPDFTSFGGCGQLLPHCQWKYDLASNTHYIMPVIYETDIFIPKGVYGIGELGQLIEDQINGVKFYKDGKIIDETNTEFRRNNLADYGTDDAFDGQMYNQPMLQYIDCVPRFWQTDHDLPTHAFAVPDDNSTQDTFLNISDYNVLMDYLVNTASSTFEVGGGFPDDGMTWNNMNGASNDAHGGGARNDNNPVRPFYQLKTNYDDGATGADGGNQSAGHKGDDANTGEEYWLYQYAIDGGGQAKRKRLIGTTNFSFVYDSVNSGFSINGLHNVKKSPSHDRFGTRIESAGQPVINFKKIRRTALNTNTWGANQVDRLKVVGALNTPETRDMGIQIHNFGKRTAKKMRTRTATLFSEECAKFSDFFQAEDDAKEAWQETIWYRLGFEYEQLNKPNGRNMIYNKGVYPDYGFTTNSLITNDILPTISTLSNPADFMPPQLPVPAGYIKPKKPSEAGSDLGTKISGVSMYNTFHF